MYINDSELKLFLKDNEWPFDYTDHDRNIARAIVFDDDGYFYFVRAIRNDDFGEAVLIETAGGGVEDGEDLHTAIKRELGEELGAEVEIVCKIGVVDDYYNLIHRHNINNYFLCKIVSFGEKNMTEDEIKSYHLSTLKLRFDEAVLEYEKRSKTKVGRLVANREIPVLERAKCILEGYANQAKVLNITNGEYFNKYFIKNIGGDAVPFCEAMMDGEAIHEIFSDEFIQIRCRELNVCTQEYRSKMWVYDALSRNSYKELRLWFGKDVFCQMNLLTLLAYLEQIKYDGRITLNYINDETFEIIERDVAVYLGTYTKLYNDILVCGSRSVSDRVILQSAIDLFFDYKSDNGKLAQTVKNCLDWDETALVNKLMGESAEYGLSDLQAKNLIKKYKRT